MLVTATRTAGKTVAVAALAVAAITGYHSATAPQQPAWIIQPDLHVRVPPHWAQAWITCLPHGQARIHAREHAARAVYVIPSRWLNGQCHDGNN